MSAEQKDNDPGIDSQPRNRAPLADQPALHQEPEVLSAASGSREDAFGADWMLVVVEGPDTGRSIHLGTQAVRIGRGRDDTFLLHDVSVTSCQLVVRWDPAGQQHWLQQAGDSPTCVNGVAVTRNARVRHRLADGDQIQIGATVLRYLRDRS